MNHQFVKYENNPVLGGTEMGTCFDVYVTRDNGRYRMDFSWRPKKSLYVTFSDDGIHWDTPQLTLANDRSTGWENDINRNCVLKVDGKYKMWYTGQATKDGVWASWIGYAESQDGIHFERVQKDPVLVCDREWESPSVMNPCVLYEDGIYKMWYSAGETYEPNVLAYAESTDGIHWKKLGTEPIFAADPKNVYEQNRVGGCQIIKTEDMGYVLFYIGYETIHKAQICIARSDDGITGWTKSPANPIISPTPEAWDGDACYKPSFLWNAEQNKWMLWYNGRKGAPEYIGYAYKEGRMLF